MKNDRVVFALTHRDLRWLAVVLAVLVLAVTAPQLWAQKSQEDYGDKLRVSAEVGEVSLATSADGKYVYIVGKRGLIVSDNYGKTGSWVQTLRLK